MSLKELQFALADVYLRPSARASLLAGYGRALERYGLSARELNAMRRIPRAELEEFCRHIMIKGSRGVQRSFPRTVALLGERTLEVLGAYFEVDPGRRVFAEKLKAFAGAVFRTLRGAGGAPMDAWEIARFELTQALLLVGSREGFPPSLFEGTDIAPYPWKSARVDGRRVRFAAGFVQSYACDVLAISRSVSARRRGQSRVEPAKPITVLFVQPSSAASMRALELGGP